MTDSPHDQDTVASDDSDALWDRAMANAYRPADSPSTADPFERPLTGRYLLLAEIARGGMGVVHRARDERLGREVAVKVMRADRCHDGELVARFLQEAQIGGQLQHPGIVPIHEVGVDAQNRPFISMELVRGQTLAALLAERKDPAENRGRFLGIYEQICHTLAFAHSRGVIHRDLKPSNVMVGTFGEIRVVDWGFAKVLRTPASPPPVRAVPSPPVERPTTIRTSEDSSKSVSGAVLGTPAYMPPEQARGEIDSLDERADVFALGAILCEILTGAPPFAATPTQDALTAAKNADLAAAVARLTTSTSDTELCALAIRCMSADRAGRPADAGEVARAISVHRSQMDERTHRAELSAAEARGRANEERRARRRTVGMSIFVITLLLAGGVLFAWQENERRQETDANDVRLRGVLGEAERLIAAEAFGPAGEALGRARGLMAANPASAAVGAELAAATEHLESSVEAARARDQRRERDANIRTRLEQLRSAGADESEAALRVYGELFRSLEIDPGSQSPEAAASIVEHTSEPLRSSLISAMDDWVARLRDETATDATTTVRPDSPRPPGAGREAGRSPPGAPGGHGPGGRGHEPAPDFGPPPGASSRPRPRGGPGGPPRTGAVPRTAERLLRILQLADADPWRATLRDAVIRDDSEALVELTRDLDPTAKAPRSLDLLALALSRAGERSAAVDVLRRAVRVHAGDLWLHYHLAAFLMEGPINETTDLAEATDHAWVTVALDPGGSFARDQLGRLLAMSSRRAEAVEVLRQGLRHAPGDPVLRASLVRELLLADDVQAALESVGMLPRETTRPDGDDDPLRGVVRSALRSLPAKDRAPRARRWLAAGVEAARIELARLSFILGRHDDVVSVREEALSAQPRNGDLDVIAAAARIAQGRYDDAEALALPARIVGHPGAARREQDAASLRAAWVAIDQGSPADSVEAVLLRARALQHRGRNDEAAACLMAALDVDARLFESFARIDREARMSSPRAQPVESGLRDAVAALALASANSTTTTPAFDDVFRARARTLAIDGVRAAARALRERVLKIDEAEAWALDPRLDAVRADGSSASVSAQDRATMQAAWDPIIRVANGESSESARHPR